MLSAPPYLAVCIHSERTSKLFRIGTCFMMNRALCIVSTRWDIPQYAWPSDARITHPCGPCYEHTINEQRKHYIANRIASAPKVKWTPGTCRFVWVAYLLWNILKQLQPAIQKPPWSKDLALHISRSFPIRSWIPPAHPHKSWELQDHMALSLTRKASDYQINKLKLAPYMLLVVVANNNPTSQ